MAESLLTLSADEQAALLRIRAQFPGLVNAVESYVIRLLETVTPLAQPPLATPAQVDELLMSLVDRVTAQCAPREASQGDELTGAIVNVVAYETRNLSTRMRRCRHESSEEPLLPGRWNPSLQAERAG